MFKFLIDEDFDHDILRAVLRRLPEFEAVTVNEVGLSGEADPVVLEWAAAQGRILLTHDANTMRDYGYRRISEGLKLPGVIIVSQAVPIGQAAADVCLIADCGSAEDFEQLVVFLPL